jgi:hypothetical protein
MQRLGCYGTCPEYSVKFNSDSTAEYNGTKYVKNIGNYYGKIDLWDFGRLCYLIDKIHFNKLDSLYEDLTTDTPSVIVEVIYKNGDKKDVQDIDDQAPIEFWALTKTIDAISSEIDWGKNK